MKQKEKELCNKHYIVVLRNEEGKLQTAFWTILKGEGRKRLRHCQVAVAVVVVECLLLIEVEGSWDKIDSVLVKDAVTVIINQLIINFVCFLNSFLKLIWMNENWSQ